MKRLFKKLGTREIKKIINSEKNILFAYLYGSFLSSGKFKDIDIAVYLKDPSFEFVADLKIELAKTLNVSSEILDITILNDILDSLDAFSLLYLERVLKEGELIVNRNFRIWSDFLERFNYKYRASEAILDEVR